MDKYGVVKDQVHLKRFAAPRFLHAVGAWIGVRALEMVKLAGWTVTQLIIWQAFTLVQWDGRCVSPFPILFLTKLNNGCTRSYTFVLADENDAILARCIGRPIDPDWDAVNIGACNAMDYAFNRLMGTPQCPIHGRRGVFPTLYTGYSYGGM